MRDDMKKVLTERPRYGGSRSYRCVRRSESRGDLEDLPRHQGMRVPYKRNYGEHAKRFSDMLGPLQRFLQSRVGSRWDDVWSEVCLRVDNASTVGRHLRDHVRWEVETDPRNVARLMAGTRGRGCHNALYVHPDGTLCRAEMPPEDAHRYVYLDGRRYRREGSLLVEDEWSRPARGVVRRIFIHGQREAVRLDGIWYWVVFGEVPPPVWHPGTQEFTGVLLHRECIDIVTGKAVTAGRYRAGKSQMSGHDLQRHGLANMVETATRAAA